MSKHLMKEFVVYPHWMTMYLNADLYSWAFGLGARIDRDHRELGASVSLGPFLVGVDLGKIGEAK